MASTTYFASAAALTINHTADDAARLKLIEAFQFMSVARISLNVSEILLFKSGDFVELRNIFDEQYCATAITRDDFRYNYLLEKFQSRYDWLHFDI